MRASRIAASLLAAALTLPVTIVAASAAPGDPWPAWTPESGGEMRTWAYDDGEWVYRNGISQNLGPNVDGLYREDYFATLVLGPDETQLDRDDVYRHLTYGAFGFDRSTHNGDYELPRDRETWPDFTADLALLAAQVDEDELFLRFRFTSMPRADAQIATVTFAGGGAAPAPAAWPNGAGVSSPWDVALTLWGTDGQIDATGEAPVGLTAAGGEIRATVEDRTWEVRIPLSVLPTGPWTLTGGAGLADPADPSAYWDVPSGRATDDAPGSGTNSTSDANVWTLLFAEGGDWQHDERVQSDLLVSLDVSEAAAVLDPAKLRAGVTEEEARRTGRLSRFYTSRVDLGDGIGRSTGQVPPFPPPFVPPPGADLRDPGVNYTYRNDLQPSFVYVPERCDAAGADCPLIVWLHGLNNYPFEPFGLFVGLEDLLEERGYVLISLLGRGDLSYAGPGEVDVLEAMADITAAYDIDESRVHVMGLSMGSGGTHRMATRYPDRFASASGFTLSGSNDLLPSLRHVKHLISHGREDFFDPLAARTGQTYDILSELGYDTVFYDWFAKTHESATFYDIGEPLFDRLDSAVVPAAPGEITYVRPVDTEGDVELGLIHDRAYWLSDIQPVGTAATGRVDARSLGIVHAPLDAPNAERATTQHDGIGLPSGRGAHQLHVTTPAYGEAAPTANRLALTTDALSALRVDTSRAGLTIDGLTVEVSASDEVALTFADATAASYTATLDGEPHPVTVTDGAVAATVPAGDHVLVFGAAATAPEPAPTPDLPATGGGAAALGLLVLLAARRRTGGRE